MKPRATTSPTSDPTHLLGGAHVAAVVPTDTASVMTASVPQRLGAQRLGPSNLSLALRVYSHVLPHMWEGVVVPVGHVTGDWNGRVAVAMSDGEHRCRLPSGVSDAR